MAAEPDVTAAPSPPAERAASGQAAHPRRWIALAVVLAASFMVLLDVSIVNVAIPSIQRELHASFGEVQFVLALYSMAYAVFLITGGRLGDIAGRKRMFMLGMAGFVVASALCGVAVSPGMLIASRVLQGVMAALMYPQVLSVIQVSFPPRERAGAFAVFGAVIGVATIAGPLLGGVLIQANILGLDWRPIFLVNVPIGAGALVAAALLLPESRAPRALKLDPGGVAIATTGLFLLVWPLVEGRDAGWPAWAFVSLVLSIPVLVGFVLFERWKTRRDGSPLVDLTLFHDRAFRIGLVVTILFLAGIPAFFLTFSIDLQIGLGFSALRTGLTTFAFALGTFLSSAASARLAGRLGKHVLVVGAGVLCAGMAGLILTIHLRGTGLSGPELYPALLVCGLGMGCVIAPLVNVVLAGIHSGSAGAASGVLTTAQQFGGALGIALVGVLFFGLLSSHASSVADGVSPALRARLTATGLSPAQTDRAVAEFHRCFTARASASDPTATPPGCAAPPRPTPVSTALADAATTARARDFSDSFVWSIVYCIAVFGATMALSEALPNPRRQSWGTSGATAAH